MRPRPAAIFKIIAAVCLSLALPSLPACNQEPLPTAAPPPHTLTVAYDLQLTRPVSELLSLWNQQNSSPISTLSDTSVAITLSAQSDHAPPDILIIAAQVPLPTGDRSPISVRPWITDPLVFFTHPDEPREPADILIDPDARIAIAVESGAMGQFTRFGLRKLRRWDLIKSRVFRHSDPDAILKAVREHDAAMGVIYATLLAENPLDLVKRSELEVSDSAIRAFIVVAQTPEGVDFARWITEPPQITTAEAFGFRSSTSLKPSTPSPEED